ncbi:MAG: hypothetical protein F6K11_18805 [Leptolyngbya sp. SIO3F4]|nr:hypothetical protein [Leptolyngbya sp. SIO3F4]
MKIWREDEVSLTSEENKLVHLISSVTLKHCVRSDLLAIWLHDVYAHCFVTRHAHPSLSPDTETPEEVTNARDIELYDVLNAVSDIMFLGGFSEEAMPIRMTSPSIVRLISKELLARSLKRGTAHHTHD